MDSYFTTIVTGIGAGAIGTTATTSGDKETNKTKRHKVLGGVGGVAATLAASYVSGSISYGCAKANACTMDQLKKEEARKAYVDSLTTEELAKAIEQLENHVIPEEQTEKNDTKSL